MARENLTGEQKTELAAQLEWIEKAYTVVGSFWAAWAIAALVGIYTRGTVKLPVFGELTFTEVVVYTLYAFTLGIPLLLFLVFRQRRIQELIAGTRLLPAPRFPKLQEAGMPRIFRTLAFLALVVLPIVAQEVAYVALCRDVCIAWKPRSWWKANDYRVVLHHDRLFTFPAKPESDRDYANWRFMRLWLPDGGVIDKKQRAPSPEDNDGRPPDAKGFIPVQISAFPGYAPWAFRISAHGSAVLAAWLLATRDGSLPRKVFAFLRRVWVRTRSRAALRAKTSSRPE